MVHAYILVYSCFGFLWQVQYLCAGFCGRSSTCAHAIACFNISAGTGVGYMSNVLVHYTTCTPQEQGVLCDHRVLCGYLSHRSSYVYLQPLVVNRTPARNIYYKHIDYLCTSRFCIYIYIFMLVSLQPGVSISFFGCPSNLHWYLVCF